MTLHRFKLVPPSANGQTWPIKLLPSVSLDETTTAKQWLRLKGHSVCSPSSHKHTLFFKPHFSKHIHALNCEHQHLESSINSLINAHAVATKEWAREWGELEGAAVNAHVVLNMQQLLDDLPPTDLAHIY